MSLELKGKIKVVFDKQTFGSGFEKREFVITTNEQYPQDVKFEVVKDKCSSLDAYQVGQEIDVHFNVRGNEYQGKYYVSLQAWKIVAGQQEKPLTMREVLDPTPQQVADPEDSDSLPF
jgi:single-strand DNA-binding protein